jgi:glutathione S-transferase
MSAHDSAAGSGGGAAAGAGGDAAGGARATLYVIPGSHACKAGMLMLEHKAIAYRTVELLSGVHPFLVRLRGFPGHRAPIRSVDGRAHRSLATLDRMGTVPALRYGSERVQGNRQIARFLDRVQPEPALFPADADRRRAVEEAELWADEVLQMTARRIGLAGALHGLDAFRERGNAGRLGPLLSRSELHRTMVSRVSARFVFRANPQSERELLEALPAMLEKIDAWIDAGVLGGETLNVADYMIAPSLALIAYQPAPRAEIEAHPAGALLERVLPEPLAAGA